MLLNTGACLLGQEVSAQAKQAEAVAYVHRSGSTHIVADNHYLPLDRRLEAERAGLPKIFIRSKLRDPCRCRIVAEVESSVAEQHHGIFYQRRWFGTKSHHNTL